MTQSWTRLFVAAAALTMTAGALQAQAPLKVGVISMQKALQETAEIKKAEADLKARFTPEQEKLAQMEKEIAKLQQDIQQNQGKYNEITLNEMAGQAQIKQRRLERESQNLQEQVNRVRQDILQRVGQRLQEIVKMVAEEQGLDMVFDVASTMYTKPALDISAAVTAAYDKKYPAQ